MTETSNIIEYKDDLIFAACELRWSKGDKFALIEAIAICAANDLEYPKWVRNQINTSMSGIFHAVFPNTPLKGGRRGLGISSLPDGPELLKMKEQFQTRAKEANKLLSLKLDRRNIVDTHIKAVRDFELAELVYRVTTFAIDPAPHFHDITNTMNDLTAALNLSPNEWQELETADGVLANVNGQTLPIRSVPSICRMATIDVIDDAWDDYKEFFLKDRTVRFEDTHSINLGK